MQTQIQFAQLVRERILNDELFQGLQIVHMQELARMESGVTTADEAQALQSIHDRAASETGQRLQLTHFSQEQLR